MTDYLALAERLEGHGKIEQQDPYCNFYVRDMCFEAAQALREAHEQLALIPEQIAIENRLTDQIERLTSAIKKANEQTEHFEREWYLRGDEVERQAAEIERLKAELQEHDKNAVMRLVQLTRQAALLKQCKSALRCIRSYQEQREELDDVHMMTRLPLAAIEEYERDRT